MNEPPTVLVADEQTDLELDVDRWARLVALTVAAEGVDTPAQASLLFVGEPEMAELNERYMGVCGPTDVLAFPIDGETASARSSEPPTSAEQGPRSLDGEPPLMLGDVVVCPAVAMRQAGDRGVDSELALLVVHGTLHLLGHDHAQVDEAARMRARETEILGRLERLDEVEGVTQK